MGEHEPQLPLVENSVVGRVALMSKVFSSQSMERLLATPNINYGRHAQAEHRINLMVMAFHFAYKIAEYQGDLNGVLEKWVNVDHILLDFRKPMEYLGHSKEFSDSLWLSVAASAFTGEIRMFSEEETAELVSNSRPAFEAIEAAYKTA